MALLTSSVKRKAWDFLFASKASDFHKAKEFVGVGLAPPAVAAPPKLNLDEVVNRAISGLYPRSANTDNGSRAEILKRLRVFVIERGFRRRKPCIFIPEKVDRGLLDMQPR
jgi:hypothetical protein